jgi:hypothetical protein
MKTGSLQREQVFSVRVSAQGIPVFITGTEFAVYLSTNNNKAWQSIFPSCDVLYAEGQHFHHAVMCQCTGTPEETKWS